MSVVSVTHTLAFIFDASVKVVPVLSWQLHSVIYCRGQSNVPPLAVKLTAELAHLIVSHSITLAVWQQEIAANAVSPHETQTAFTCARHAVVVNMHKLHLLDRLC